jgi:hypothetical protein
MDDDPRAMLARPARMLSGVVLRNPNANIV